MAAPPLPPVPGPGRAVRLGGEVASHLIRTVHNWSIAVQQQARRNAMIAATDCAARRAERDDVNEYLAEHPASKASTEPQVDSSDSTGQAESERYHA